MIRSHFATAHFDRTLDMSMNFIGLQVMPVIFFYRLLIKLDFIN